MGRRRCLAALVLAAVMLSGCGWMDGSYVSVTPHEVGREQSREGEIIAVSSYAELRSALVELVDSGTEESLLSLAEYPREDAVADMERAIEHVMGVYPLGAYAVESIDYAFGTALGASALSVDISYRHSREELDRIRTVRWTSGAEQAVKEALHNFDDELVLQITGYQQTDFEAMVRAYARENPDRIMETPQVTVNVYPDRGDTRVVELIFDYRTNRETLRSMQEQVQPVFSSAALYVSGQADDGTKFAQLQSFLMERLEYSIAPVVTPAYSLLCLGVGDSESFALVYAAMCSRIGLEAGIVEGTLEGQPHFWNRICIDGSWYHLDLLDARQFQPKTDAEMTGYEWDRSAFSANGETSE